MIKNVMLIGMLLISLLLIGCGQNDTTPPQEPMVQMTQTKPTVAAYGIVKATAIQNITIDFPAVLKEMLVLEGQQVKQGTPLANLDLLEYHSQIRNKEIELEIAEIKLQKAGFESQKAQNELENAQAAYQKTLADLKRKQELVKAGAIPQTELEGIEKIAAEEATTIQNLQLSLQSTETSERELQQAEVSRLQNELAQMRNRLSKNYLKGSQLICPLEKGLVDELGGQNGDILSAEKMALSLIDLNSLVIEADVPEDFIKDVQLGAKATVTPLSDPEQHYAGQVSRIGGRALEKKGETVVAVEIILEEKGELLPGFNVDVEIEK